MVGAPVCIHKKNYKCNHSKHTRSSAPLRQAAVSHHTNRATE